MLQRIQTIYLLLVIIIATVLLFANIPLLEITTKDKGIENITYQSGYPNFVNLPIVMISLILLIITSIISIFSFKNQKLQLRITSVLFVLILAFSGLIFYGVNLNSEIFSSEIITKLNYKWGLYIPLLMGIFAILAFRGIKKDLRRLKSSRSIR